MHVSLASIVVDAAVKSPGSFREQTELAYTPDTAGRRGDADRTRVFARTLGGFRI